MIEVSMSEKRKKISVKFGLSRKRHLPVIWVANQSNYLPYRLDVFFKYHGLTFEKIDEEYFLIRKNGFEFVLLKEYLPFMIYEFVEWHRDYKFPSSLENKTILDIGAGCGETIFFFALNGCRNFIAVEPNPQCADLIRKNAEKNSLNVKIFNDTFRKNHLNENFDFIKCDCEGGESILLEEEISKPIALEVHGEVLIKKFQEKHFKITSKIRESNNVPICTMRNF
jgi:hypothetical protein